MDLFPAIDLRDGRSVRLIQGDFTRERVYGDPVASAEEMAAEGATHLHVVDLDAARTGEPVNRDVVAAICAKVADKGVFVQCGGGIRDEGAAQALLGLGVDRVVLGTAAVERPGLVRRLARRFPGRIAVALDYSRAGRREVSRLMPAGGSAVSLAHARVAVRGWTAVSGESLLDVLSCFEDAGAAAVMCTDVGRDGMLTGPDLAGLSALLDATRMEVVASGGVSGAADLKALAHLGTPERRLAGVIVGMALREHRLSLPDALRACAASG